MLKFNHFFESKNEISDAQAAQDLGRIADKSGDELKEYHIQWQNGNKKGESDIVHRLLFSYPNKNWNDLASLAKVGSLKGLYESLKTSISPEELSKVVGAEFALIAGLTGDEMMNLHIQWQKGNKDPKGQAVHDYLYEGNNPHVRWDELASRALESAYVSLYAHVVAPEAVSSSKSKASVK